MLAIDDMRDPAVYETYLRPILNRLKAIDGRAPVSIMTNQVKPNDPRLQAWLKEGLSIEVHTLTHPCPLLAEGRLRRGRPHLPRLRRPDEPDPRQHAGRLSDALLRLDQHASAPASSPRSSTRPAPAGSSSRSTRRSSRSSRRMTRACRATSSSTRTARSGSASTSRSRRSSTRSRTTPIRTSSAGCAGSSPASSPSDWEGQNLHKPDNPKTLEDMKAALDCVVIKQGVFNLVFHPHGWIKPEQVVELIDHAVAKHGKKVKFLTFKEALERLNKNLLEGSPLRQTDGSAAVRSPARRSHRPATRTFRCLPAPASSDDQGRDAGLRFVDLDEDGQLDVVFSNDQEYGIYLFESDGEGLDAEGHGGQGRRTRCLAEDRPRRHRTTASSSTRDSLWWQNEDTAKLPNLVDRRSFNDLLKDVEPRGKSPAAVAEVDPRRTGIHGRAGRDRAAGQGPDRLRLGRRRQALGRRDGRLSAGHRRQGEARRRGPRSSKTPTATAATTSRRPSSKASASRPA